MKETEEEREKRSEEERAKRIENTVNLLAGFIKENFSGEQADDLLDTLGVDKEEE